MKRNILATAIALTLSFLLLGCSGMPHTNHVNRDIEAHHSHNEVAGINGLSLNNGERWEMDNHTRKISTLMEKTFFNGDHTSQSGLNALGVELDAQMNKLIAGCTMKGEAHNQLHAFLNKHIPTIKTLATAPNLETARASAIELKGQIKIYKEYFK
tara:strand:+ start:6086 stop:6553 length:468 start_codon:yes stop_codon:yes gene_type:complete